MKRSRCWAVCCILGMTSCLGADESKLDAHALAKSIDHLIAREWRAKGVQPAPLSDDAEFIRRAFLDLAGRIPSIVEARDFLDDRRADKRRRWIDQLIQGVPGAKGRDSFSDNFSIVLRRWTLAGSVNNKAELQSRMEGWLRQKLQKASHYDRLVREIIASPQSSAGRSTFQQANASLPENLAGSSARAFLGITLACAQCHDDRSGGSWTQKEFWQFAAFFVASGPSRIQVSNSNRVVEAQYLGGGRPEINRPAREALAGWMTAKANPFFARATANRLWTHFFGIGLIDPPDEGGKHNRPSHPELLDLLSRQLVAHDFDLKYLIRAIVNSRTYQLGSVKTRAGRDKQRLFARMAVRGLSPEQLFESLAQVTELAPGASRMTRRNAFLARFAGDDDRPTETRTSLLQALYFMNSKFMINRTSLLENRTLSIVANQRTSTARKIETLYLLVLSRKPRPAEKARLVQLVEAGGPANDSRVVLADVFWALLNSAEFQVNH